MRIRLLLISVFFTVFTNVSYSQLSGGNAFLQGRYVEIGQDNVGAMGTCAAIAGYHPHNSGAGPTPGGYLAQVYDCGHDGWTTGVPQLMGDYTDPGYPQEGWSLQIGATEYRNWVSGGLCSNTMGGTPVPGTFTGYSNTGGIATSIWTGGIAGVKVVMESRIDTESSGVVFTVRFYNTTAAPIAGVYYERTCDPDNVSTWGITSATHNRIVHQNEDARHGVLISSTGDYPTYGTYSLLTYLGLGTKDCRAKCMVVPSLYPTTTPATLWSGVGGGIVISALGDSNYTDQGISLVYNIGTLAAAGSAGDSAIISYAYFFNTNSGFDSIFPDPTMVVNGFTRPCAPQPEPTYDTFYSCANPGVVLLPVDIDHAIDKCWSWSTWTWSPSIGLASTTGVHNTININALTGITTYTIVGTDSNANMYSCNRRIFYLTIIPCHSAHANSPCVGDTLYVWDKGDSTLATYSWTGPAGWSSVQQYNYIYPATMANEGLYFVTKIQGGVVKKDSVYVTIHPLPVLNMTSDLPLCAKMTSTVNLSVTPDSLGETYSWTGPGGFTSTSQFPAVTPFDSSSQGVYIVNAVSPFGCKNMNSIGIYAAPEPQYDTEKHLGCVFDTVYFRNLSFNADTFTWDFGDLTPTVTTYNPGGYIPVVRHIFAAGHKKYLVQLTTSNPHCTENVKYLIDLQHSVHSVFDAVPDTFCLGLADTMFNTSFTDKYSAATTPISYHWDFADGTSDNTTSPLHTFNEAGMYPITLTVTDDLNCVDSMKDSVFVLQMKISSLHDTLLCISEPLVLHSKITITPPISVNYNYAWAQSSQNLNDPNIQEPSVFGVGTFGDTLTVTIPGVPPDACPTRDTITIHSVLGMAIANLTPNQAIKYGNSVQLNADSQIIYYWLPNDGTLTNCNISNPVATPFITTTYTVYGLDKNGCLDSAYVTIYVDSTMNEGIPTAFTPNGDGLNDVFHLTGIRFQRLVEMRIFNRWGQQVFYTNDAKKGWDGTFNNVPQDLGTYYYEIIVARPGGNGNNLMFKGEITLIR